MKAEAIQALQLFKQMHMAQPEPQENQPVAEPTQETKVRNNPNYPAHIKPLKDRIMSALNNGARTAEAVAKYCKEDSVKLVNLQLGRWVSRGMIGKQTNAQSGITRFYPYAEAKAKGILQKPAPINRKGKKVKEQKRSSPSVESPSLYTAEFLEERVIGWQNEARRLATENEDLKAKLSQAQVMLIEARQTRNVTSEVTEVMQEVRDLRATVAYLESKLFGGK
jgi:chemotaxis receptor (MCP) glutamine deamidase CheD